MPVADHPRDDRDGAGDRRGRCCSSSRSGRYLTWIVVAAFFAVALTPSWTGCSDGVRAPALAGDAAGVPRRPPGARPGWSRRSPSRSPRRARSSPGSCRSSSRTPGRARADRRPARPDQRAAVRPAAPGRRSGSFASGLTTPAAGVLRGVATGIAGTLTIFVLAYLMVLEGAEDHRQQPGAAPRAPPAPGAARRLRLRPVDHRLHLRQPADQRHLRRSDLRRAQDRRRPVRRADLVVRRDRRPHPARRRDPRRGRRRRRGLRALGAGRHRDHRLLRRLPAAGEPPAAAARSSPGPSSSTR